jgi:5'(3')-deoxyribonucleotidase
MNILLDLDDVLVDFVDGACRVFNTTRFRLCSNWEPGNWDMIPALSKTVNEVITPDYFWERIHHLGSEFWFHLDNHTWMQRLVNVVEKLDPNWHLVTAPAFTGHISSYQGKCEWIKEEFGHSFDRFAITPHKHLFARHDSVLVDDRETTVNKFRELGSNAILFPAHHNSKHEFKNDPLSYVIPELEKLCT